MYDPFHLISTNRNCTYSENIAIKDIRPGLKNINVVFIVLEVGPATVTKENREVRTFKVGDPTASINVSVWDEPGKLLVPGDIVRLTKGYASVWRSCLTLYSGKNGDIHRIGDFCMNFNELLNMSEPNINLQINPMVPNNGTQTNSNNNGGPPRSGPPVSVSQPVSNIGNIQLKSGVGTVTGREPPKSSSSSSSGSNAGKNSQRGRGNQTRSNVKSDRR